VTNLSILKLLFTRGSCITALLSVVTSACSLPQQGESTTKVVVPSADFIAEEKKGKQLFAKYCSACHGTNAKGTKQGPSLLHKMYNRHHHSDMTFYKAAQYGIYQHHWHFGNMPPVKNITPQQTGHIIKFIRVKQSTTGDTSSKHRH